MLVDRVKNSWLFPPPSIVSRVIKHLSFSKADATLVVPFWPSAPWWPCLTYDGLTFRPEVIDLMVIDLQPSMFIPAVRESQVFNYGLALSLTSMLHYKDNELLYLANMLPSILLLDKAPNTVRKYFSVFRKWEFWANSKSVSALPVVVKSPPLFLGFPH